MANDKLTWVELRKVVAETAHISEQEAGQFLNALLEGVMEGLKADKQVKIKGIGTFALKAVAPRKSVNIATGESITIEGYNKLTFNAESVLKENVEKRLEQPKTEAVVAELVNDPIKKLGEQADEIVDILAELGQAVAKPSDEGLEVQKVSEVQEVSKENNEETDETLEEPTAEEPAVELTLEPIEEVVEEEKPIAEEPTDKPTCKPTCKCHKWVCWVIGVLLLLGIVGVGIYFRATLIQCWQCMQDCRPVAEDDTTLLLIFRPENVINHDMMERKPNKEALQDAIWEVVGIRPNIHCCFNNESAAVAQQVTPAEGISALEKEFGDFIKFED